MKNAYVYSELQKIINDHLNKELTLKVVRDCLDDYSRGANVDIKDLIKKIDEALK